VRDLLGTHAYDHQTSSDSRTAIGLRVKDGVVLAVEKLVHSKLLIPEANRRIQTVDRHIGMVSYHPCCLHIAMR
jgi:20S proteasome subunit alpha 7